MSARRWDILLAVALGGALGSLARWALAESLPHAADELPWGTVTANVVGAFLLGALMVVVLETGRPGRYLRPFLGVGVLGGFTTFSTYMLDTRVLLAEGEPLRAGGYLFGTLVAGLLAVWLGVVAARTTTGRRRREH